jgi:subtilisin-like proprotein convertase family protein
MSMYNDPLSNYQWHLLQIGRDRLGVEYSGANIKVGVFDDGLQADHPDIAPNYNSGLHVTIAGQAVAPDAGAHGTAVAGIIAAAANATGGVGVAYEASVAGIDLFNGPAATDFVAAIRQMARFDVVNNSWGLTGAYSDNPNERYSLGYDFERALDHAARKGRGGLGSVIVNAAGNEWDYDRRDANTSAFNQDRHTITVGAVTDRGAVSSYSVRGASVLVSAPSSGGSQGITTTDVSGYGGYEVGDATSGFGGTSAATPIVSGVVALMLEANPRLGWRDVQDILAHSADRVGGGAFGWTHNGAKTFNGGGLHFSNDAGFGRIDAFTAVRKAEIWSLFGGPQTSRNEVHAVEKGDLDRALADRKSASFSFKLDKAVDLEHVDLSLTLSHGNVSQLKIVLVSPEGTRSMLLSPGGDAHRASSWTWTLGSEAFRGESGKGVWTVKVTDTKAGAAGTIESFAFDAYGHKPQRNDVYHYTDEFRAMAARDRSRAVVTDQDGGQDWLDLAGFTDGIVLDLHRGALSRDAAGNGLFKVARRTDIEHAVLGDGNDVVVGNALNNRLLGMRGDDTLIGGPGKDRLIGGAGTDTADYSGSNRAVAVDLLAGQGSGGHAAGDSLAEIENLVGSAAADTLSGDDAGNRLDGRGGSDVLVGRGGADAFVFSGPGSGSDRVLDFQDGVDHVDLRGYGLSFAGLSVYDSAGGAVVAAAGGAMVLSGMSAALLTQDDFLF